MFLPFVVNKDEYNIAAATAGSQLIADNMNPLAVYGFPATCTTATSGPLLQQITRTEDVKTQETSGSGRRQSDDGRETENRYLDNRRHITSAHTKSEQCADHPRATGHHRRRYETIRRVRVVRDCKGRAGRKTERRIQRYMRSDGRRLIATRPTTNPLNDVSIRAPSHCYAAAGRNRQFVFNMRQAPASWVDVYSLEPLHATAARPEPARQHLVCHITGHHALPRPSSDPRRAPTQRRISLLQTAQHSSTIITATTQINRK